MLCWSSLEEISHVQGKRNPSETVGVARGHQRADAETHNHRKLANLITRTTALSNSLKLSHAVWGHPGWTCRIGDVSQNVVHWRKLIKLITWTTALSNSMKLRAMLCMATQDRQVMVETSDKTWSTGEGNVKPFQYSCLENPMNSMKRQKDGH